MRSDAVVWVVLVGTVALIFAFAAWAVADMEEADRACVARHCDVGEPMLVRYQGCVCVVVAK